MQATVSLGECEKEMLNSVSRNLMKRKAGSFSQPKTVTVQTKDIGTGDHSNEVMEGELSNTMHSQKPILHIKNEDAICMRTRAHYSLASFTLYELEIFLQETDDEDFRNV